MLTNVLKTSNMNFTNWIFFENFGEKDSCSWLPFAKFYFMDKLPLNLIFQSFFLQLQHYDNSIAKWKCAPIDN